MFIPLQRRKMSTTPFDEERLQFAILQYLSRKRVGESDPEVAESLSVALDVLQDTVAALPSTIVSLD